MREQKAIFMTDILKNIINVYFDTFFVFYFFTIANYDVVPLAKYYISLYLSIGLGFFLIRNGMKKNLKVPYFRIGISMQALYIAAIMLLKEKIITFIIPVGILKGLADGFYHFPKNILNSEKIDNEARQRFSGTINTINKVMSIIIPLVIGVILTYMSYTDLGKIFFLLFIVMFVISFALKEKYGKYNKFDVKRFMSVVKENGNVSKALIVTFLSGLTYSSGVMGTIVTLSKINNFKTNLNLGFVDSACAALSLVVCVIYAWKMKKKHFNVVLLIAGITSLLALVYLGVAPSITSLIVYLFVRWTSITSVSLISDNIVTDLSNTADLKSDLKEEYYFARDIVFAFSRSFGYVILFLVATLFGMKYINYILILAGASIFVEALLLRRVKVD